MRKLPDGHDGRPSRRSVEQHTIGGQPFCVRDDVPLEVPVVIMPDGLRAQTGKIRRGHSTPGLPERPLGCATLIRQPACRSAGAERRQAGSAGRRGTPVSGTQSSLSPAESMASFHLIRSESTKASNSAADMPPGIPPILTSCALSSGLLIASVKTFSI